MNTTRRLFLTGASLLAMDLRPHGLRPGAAVAPDAASPDVIGDILKSDRRGNWSDDFDAQASAGREGRLEAADLLAADRHLYRGGDRPVPADRGRRAAGRSCRPPRSSSSASIDPDVEALRKRLMVSGDLSQRAGMSQSFDTYVDAAVKRFQTRHGLPADGVMGKYTYAAMNISAPGAARPARDQSGAPALDVGLPRRPLRDGQHPGRPDRGGREQPRRAAPHRDRRQDRPADADRQFQDQRDHRQPVLERAGIDRAQGHHSADAEESRLSDQEQHPHPRPRRQRDRSDDDRLEHRGRGEIPAAARIRVRATPWPR